MRLGITRTIERFGAAGTDRAILSQFLQVASTSDPASAYRLIRQLLAIDVTLLLTITFFSKWQKTSYELYGLVWYLLQALYDTDVAGSRILATVLEVRNGLVLSRTL
ncbi:hypothetical protein ONZ51_g2559 [Trametes cubensis]|uniref:Uncharacterized protein n=1 Tax=Trametes cubensis TaxID=1111947 RepID=A0AAD7XEE3_9APHY|nr:hypothetical protein ONZ51_g2559 [Trametes cubensis]